MEPIFYTVTRKVLMPGDHEKEIEPYYKDVYIEKKKYTVTRMLPPGKIKYIFSNPKKLRCARDHPFKEETRPKNTFLVINYGGYKCIRWLR